MRNGALRFRSPPSISTRQSTICEEKWGSTAGTVIEANEALSAEAALALYLADPADLGRQRAIAVGAPADLCLLDRPWSKARTALSVDLLSATWISGRLVHDCVD